MGNRRTLLTTRLLLLLVFVCLLLYGVNHFKKLVQEASTKYAEKKKTRYGSSPEVLETSTKDPEKEKIPVILIWVAAEYGRRWSLPNTETCGGGCVITNNRSRFDESDAVMFFMKWTNASSIPNQIRRPEQLFVWWCGESAHHVRNLYGHQLTELPPGFFNLTMHYRSDSDVVGNLMPHSARDWYLHRVGRGAESSVEELKPVTTEEQFDEMFKNLMKVKTKSAAWLISDCAEPGVTAATPRLTFGRSVQNNGNYSVDIFGKCGALHMPKRHAAMFDTIRKYKFYFAFENTRYCKEYLAEKFWYNSLYAGAVPVVWGSNRAEYERIAPPGSFIHADDFDNDPVKLAEFLRKLDSDDATYKSYFRWWMMPGFYPIYKLRPPPDPRDDVQDNTFECEVNGFCHLCRLLRDRRYSGRVTQVHDLRSHFYGKESEQCLLGRVRKST